MSWPLLSSSEAPALALADGAVLIGEPDGADARGRPSGRGDSHRRRRRQDAPDRRRRRAGDGDRRRRLAAGNRERERPLDRRARVARRRLRLERGQTGQRPRRDGGGEELERALERARPRLPAEGLSARCDALQRRLALVPQGRGRPADARMERRASGCDLFRPTGAFSSPRCRRTRCTAGGSPIRATCA